MPGEPEKKENVLQMELLKNFMFNLSQRFCVVKVELQISNRILETELFSETPG